MVLMVGRIGDESREARGEALVEVVVEGGGRGGAGGLGQLPGEGRGEGRVGSPERGGR